MIISLIKTPFNLEKFPNAIQIEGKTPWKEKVAFDIGDILKLEIKAKLTIQFKIVEVFKSFQGCFSTPKFRKHHLVLEPINHSFTLKVGDELNLIGEL